VVAFANVAEKPVIYAAVTATDPLLDTFTAMLRLGASGGGGLADADLAATETLVNNVVF